MLPLSSKSDEKCLSIMLTSMFITIKDFVQNSKLAKVNCKIITTISTEKSYYESTSVRPTVSHDFSNTTEVVSRLKYHNHLK